MPETTNSNKSSPHLGQYFNDVEIYSQQHLSDIEKFDRFLEIMKGSLKSSADQKAYIEFQNEYQAFNRYMSSNGIMLTENEKNEISAITGSKLPPASTKRMMEDLIHKIKTRHESEKRSQLEQSQIIKEIEELKSSKSAILDWFKLTKFAIDYGTITIFSHKLKDSAFSIIREKIFPWQEIIESSILPIMNKEYYLLSTLEYNALEILLQLKIPLSRIMQIRQSSSYDPRPISQEFDSLSDIYLVILKNSSFIESSFQKAVKNRKQEHGLYGFIKFIIDQPIKNGRAVKLSYHDFITETVTGLLLSYYTSREKIIIKSINQIIYLLEAHTNLDGAKKHLTRYAENLDKESRNKKQTEEKNILEKINIIDRILEIFLKSAPELEDRIFRIESESLYKKWSDEFQTRPVSKIIRLTEGFIRQFIDLINDMENFILLYDGREYKDYFRDYPQITEAADAFNFNNFELSGTKLKEMLNISIPPETNPRQFIFTITRMDIPKSALNPTILLAKSILQKISNRSYELAVRLNETISYYCSQKEINHDTITKNYDFFINAVLKKSKTSKTAVLLKKDEITLKDFMEAACSLSYYIAKELNHEGIESLSKEKENLNKKIDLIKTQSEDKDSDKTDETDDFNDAGSLDSNNAVLDEINDFYKDALTGLWKIEYFEDQVIPKLYNDHRNYKFDNTRIVFLCEINGLKKVNDQNGHSAGDKILQEVSKRILSSISKPEMNRNNIAIKYEGCFILGYLNDISLSKAVDIFAEINSDIFNLNTDFRISDIESIHATLNSALYQERTGTNADRNIAVAKKILAFVNERSKNNIAFPKDINMIITERNFNRYGMLDESVLTLYRK